EEVAHVGDCLTLRFGHKVVDRLHEAIVISNRQSQSPPVLAFDEIRGPASLGRGRGQLVDRECAFWFDRHRLSGSTVFQKQPPIYVDGKNVSRNSNRDGALIRREGLLDVSDGIR